MFRKLKLKFIAISTFSMMIVLFFVLGIIILITYKNTLSEIYSTLEFISEHSFSNSTFDENAYKDKDITPETQYETRYITVICNNGEYNINSEHIAAIDESEIDTFIDLALSSSKERGIYTFDGLSYAFIKKDTKTGFRLTIMDCTRNISSVNLFIRFSFYIGAVSMLLLILILSVFARRVAQPYIKNAEAQKQFITNASHELKTPLAVISANTEVIELMNGKSEWTESTINQVNRMSELISQLVVLSKLEEREDLVLTDVCISEQAAKSVANYKTVAETRGLTFDSEIEEDIHINADEKGVYELINILLDNAIKYADDGGNVSVRLARKGKNAIINVSNDYEEGDGVDFSRFFDRFYREDKSHSSEKQGYGIGLSMAESLVGMFKGRISVSYKKPVITFTVVL